MTINQTLNLGTQKLKSASTSASLDAEVLLYHVLNKPKEHLFANPQQLLSSKAKKQFFALVKKRVANWPMAYLTNHKGFYGLDFYVDKNVLIPRPVTEDLVEMVLAKTKKQNGLSVLDVGTGSGCIIISLAKNSSGKFFASDISTAALRIAKKNSRAHKTKVQFKQGDLLAPWKNQSFDIIIANLPYLSKRTDPSTKFEPTKALIAKDSGFALIEKLFHQIAALPRLPQHVYLEIGHDQGPKVVKSVRSILPNYNLKVLKDLPGKVRYAVLNKKPVRRSF